MQHSTDFGDDELHGTLLAIERAECETNALDPLIAARETGRRPLLCPQTDLDRYARQADGGIRALTEKHIADFGQGLVRGLEGVLNLRSRRQPAGAQNLPVLFIPEHIGSVVVTPRLFPAPSSVRRKLAVATALVGGFLTAGAAWAAKVGVSQQVQGTTARLFELAAILAAFMVGGLLGWQVQPPSVDFSRRRRARSKPVTARMTAATSARFSLLVTFVVFTVLWRGGADTGRALILGVAAAWHGGLDFSVWNALARRSVRHYEVVPVDLVCFLVPRRERGPC